MYEGTITDFDTGLRIEAKYFGQLLSGSVARNLMRTLFVNRRQAEKLAARPLGIPKSELKCIGVLGAGMMGSGICLAAATAGIEVTLIDTTQEAADRGLAYARSALLEQSRRGTIAQEGVNSVLGRISATSAYSRLNRSQLIVEAVYESREVKGDAIRNAERHIPANTVIASNTSTLPITGLAKLSQRPDHFIGLHFFSPAERMPLLEIIRGRQTSDETLAVALDFAALLKKTPIIVNDSPGFYTSRVFSTFIDEGACMLAEGIEPALIENAAKMAGMPVGPLAQFDEVSQELSWQIIQQARADGLDRHLARADVAPIVEKLLALDRKGRRYAGGFYEYPPTGQKQLWHGLREHFPPLGEQPMVEDVKERLLSIQALEAARCFEEGIVTSAADADIGSVLGIGFPSWTGGTLSYIDMVGPAAFVANCERLCARHGARFKPARWLVKFAAEGRTFHDTDLSRHAPAG
jgi:3-hydroxyacyl-CoA dehydrogenase/enoyl-CoA hydratase/3-hydroxybutyryl-CoA epimerase